MLTPELIKANTSLQGLTEDQIKAITELSKNDENDVIGKKIGEVYGNLDADILSASGITKNGTEKTYDYAKRALGELKTKSEGISTLQTQIDALTKEKKHLEDTIAKGSGDQETIKNLKQAKLDLEKVTSQYNELNTKYSESEANHSKEIFGIKIESELNAATSGLKFRSDLPTSVKDIVLKQAIDKVKSMRPEMVDDASGVKKVIFRNEDGSTMLNTHNNLNPFTPAELLNNELASMDVLEKARTQAGSGTRKLDDSKTKPVQSYDLSGAKTQNEAYNTISAQLKQQGIMVGTDDFENALNTAWVENKITDLPA